MCMHKNATIMFEMNIMHEVSEAKQVRYVTKSIIAYPAGVHSLAVEGFLVDGFRVFFRR